MHYFWQLPVAINDASKQKYARYTVHESLASSPHRKVKKKETRNPFDCLNRHPHSNSKSNYSNVKSLPLSRARLDNTLDFSLLPSLPPITSVTAPRASALKAYQEVHSFAKSYLRDCAEEVGQELGQLKRLHGSVSSLNGRMEQLCHSAVVILDPVLNILFESLQAEAALREQRMQQAATHFRKAQFYSLKMQQYLFAGHCYIEEAEIYKSQGKLQRGLTTLKKALGIAIYCGNEELQLSVLQKMGMLYYYNGNTAAGEQYHRMAERGLTPKELEMFNQFSLNAEMRVLHEELFSLAPTQKPTTKQFTRYDAEINSDLQEESVIQRKCEVSAMVAKMLKDSREKTIGAKLKKHIKNTLSLATIIPHSRSPPTSSTKENLPFVNVSQVLKSHLSRNRGGNRAQRDWQIRTLLQMIDSLARCLP